MSDSKIGVGMIGCGTVGGGVARLLHEMTENNTRPIGAAIELRRVLVRDPNKSRAHQPVDGNLLTDDADAFFTTPDMPIVIEVAGGGGVISQYVRRALEMGKHVVTANKSLLATEGPSLLALARRHHVAIAFEASCAGGIPVVTALQFGLAANQIHAMYGILNGTCNYILTQMTQFGQTYHEALAGAQEQGFAEADPTLDVSGQDAAQKLAILASLAFGIRATGEQVWSEGIDRLSLSDIRFAAELGYEIKLLAIAQRLGDDRSNGAVSMRVHPCFIRTELPLAQVHGSYNALSVFGHAVGHTMFYGHGAGMMPTASAVVGDLLNIASGWYPQAFDQMSLWREDQPIAQPMDPDDLTHRYYIRVLVKNAPGVLATLGRILGDADISLSAVLQHEETDGQFVPLVITTHEAREGSLRQALKRIAQQPIVEGSPTMVRIVDLPRD